MILDLFAGPGGWDEGARQLGLETIGIEIDADACATRAAAGHQTIRADVAELAPRGKISGLIASPPCQSFSQGGDRLGHADLRFLFEHARACLGGWQPIAPGEFADSRSALVLEPLRWALALCPEWIACEQVPQVLPLWEVLAELLEAHGWLCWSGLLNAANFGVPQKRTRAILLAHRRKAPLPPPASHEENPQPVLFGEELQPWVCMADALGWAEGDRIGFPRRDDLGSSESGYRDRDRRAATEPSFTLTEKARSWTRAEIVVNTGRDWKPGEGREAAQQIPISEPSPALDGTHGGAGRWWWQLRPSTTIQGDPRCWPPGHKINGEDIAAGRTEYQGRAGEDAIRLSLAEALILQGFPPDYPIAGGMTSSFRQVGNAIPPPLARPILAELLR